MSPPKPTDLPTQIKRLKLGPNDIVIARVDESLLRGKLQSVADEIRKTLIATGNPDTVLLVLPSHMDIFSVSREMAQRALETLASFDATATDREQATKTLTRGEP